MNYFDGITTYLGITATLDNEIQVGVYRYEEIPDNGIKSFIINPIAKNILI